MVEPILKRVYTVSGYGYIYIYICHSVVFGAKVMSDNSSLPVLFQAMQLRSNPGSHGGDTCDRGVQNVRGQKGYFLRFLHVLGHQRIAKL